MIDFVITEAKSMLLYLVTIFVIGFASFTALIYEVMNIEVSHMSWAVSSYFFLWAVSEYMSLVESISLSVRKKCTEKSKTNW